MSTVSPTGEQQCYHSSTRLPDGRLSVIVDTGAWTNLMGENLAKAIGQRAVDHGLKPEQRKMAEPLNIQGVGGYQKCEWQVTCPVAVPDGQGTSALHRFSAPVVRQSGSNLPGLLGLKSMEEHRAVIDITRKMLIFPGPGDVEIKLPPGSIEIQLEKAPSGHLVIPVDSYGNLAKRKGGLQNPTLELHASIGQSEPFARNCSASASARQGGADDKDKTPPAPPLSAEEEETPQL
jgi:hypothetical protein